MTNYADYSIVNRETMAWRCDRCGEVVPSPVEHDVVCGKKLDTGHIYGTLLLGNGEITNSVQEVPPLPILLPPLNFDNFVAMGWDWNGIFRFFRDYEPAEGYHIVTAADGNQWIEKDVNTVDEQVDAS